MNLIQNNGVPRWGHFTAPPNTVNWQDFDARDSMGHPRARWLKPFLFKHFDFYGAQGQGFTVGLGMVRLGLVNSTFFYAYSPHLGLVRQQFDLPGDWGLDADYRPYGETRWRHPLKSDHWAISQRTPEYRKIQFHLGNRISGEMVVDCAQTDLLSMNTPIANTGFAYAQKTTGAPVSGVINVGGQSLVLDPHRDGCYHDWTAGFLRRDTFWNWACATGRRSAEEPLIAINLARGVNETSAHENALWVNGRMHVLPLSLYEYDRDNVMKPWRVYSQCGGIQLRFLPEGRIEDHRNLWVIQSRFNQCFGTFFGEVTVPETGEAISVDGLRGWCEDHFARW